MQRERTNIVRRRGKSDRKLFKNGQKQKQKKTTNGKKRHTGTSVKGRQTYEDRIEEKGRDRQSIKKAEQCQNMERQGEMDRERLIKGRSGQGIRKAELDHKQRWTFDIQVKAVTQDEVSVGCKSELNYHVNGISFRPVRNAREMSECLRDTKGLESCVFFKCYYLTC